MSDEEARSQARTRMRDNIRTLRAAHSGLRHRTDLGNAERLIDRHGDDLCYCHPWKRWLVWDGQRWQHDETAEITRRAQATVRAIYTESAQPDDEHDRKALATWAMKSEARSKIESMVALAATLPGVPVLPDELDTDPWRLNVANGTLDLRSGELRPHRRLDFITKLVPVDYNPDAQAPRWEAFLERITGGNKELLDFLQLATGYSLTGSTGEECVFIPYGIGRNGKSKFLGALADVLGDYAQQLPRESLMTRVQGGIPNDVAKLKGARFVTAIETGEGRRLDEQLIKQLTGGDRISARFLHAEFFEFIPECKVWLATNHKPRVSGTDEGIWSRIRLIPFEVVIPLGERDPQLAAKLRDELPGILAWAVDGCLRWQRAGLGMPEPIKQATEGYRAEEDALGEFIGLRCVLDDASYAYAADLYDAYIAFTGDRRLSQRAFGLRLRERGFDKAKMGHPGRNAWLGIGLLAEEPGNE